MPTVPKTSALLAQTYKKLRTSPTKTPQSKELVRSPPKSISASAITSEKSGHLYSRIHGAPKSTARPARNHRVASTPSRRKRKRKPAHKDVVSAAREISSKMTASIVESPRKGRSPRKTPKVVPEETFLPVDVPVLSIPTDDATLFTSLQERMESFQETQTALHDLAERVDTEGASLRDMLTWLFKTWSDERTSIKEQFDHLASEYERVCCVLQSEQKQRAELETLLAETKAQGTELVSRLNQIMGGSVDTSAIAPALIRTVPVDTPVAPVPIKATATATDQADICKWAEMTSQSLATQSQALQLQTATIKSQIDASASTDVLGTSSQTTTMQQVAHEVRDLRQLRESLSRTTKEAETDGFDANSALPSDYAERLVHALSLRAQAETTDRMHTSAEASEMFRRESSTLADLESKVLALERQLDLTPRASDSVPHPTS